MEEIKKDTGFAITGEDTPFYFWKKEAVERISHIIPNSKLIVIFRNPVDRAYSNYYLAVITGNEELSFNKFTLLEDVVKQLAEANVNYATSQQALNKEQSELNRDLGDGIKMLGDNLAEVIKFLQKIGGNN